MKSYESPPKVHTKIEALEALKHLEALEPHLSNEIIVCESVDEIVKKIEDHPFPDVEKELEKKEIEVAELYETNLFELFETEFARPITNTEMQRLSQWATDYDDKLIRYALREMLTYSKKSFDYVDKILFSWKENNFTSEMYEDGKR